MQPVQPDANENARQTPGRRLAAVGFVDIVGYSLLMNVKEHQTHERWMALLSGVLKPAMQEHHGRMVKSTGDGVLVEFSDAFEAVEWANSVQRTVIAQQLEGDPIPIALRIGLHLGYVIPGEDDIYGDDVNIAARLQEYAEAGGIVMSEAVYNVWRNATGRRARDLGFLALKNMSPRVHAYAIDESTKPVLQPIREALASLPSIAVMPLRNMDGTPQDDYFANGVVEDIIVSLANLRELVVIARASTLAWRGQDTDSREIGRQLGVRYVLSGNIRRLGRSLRIKVELSDALTGVVLWGERAEVAEGELFDLQDRIVVQIVAGLVPNLRSAELRGALRKRPENFTAYDHMLRALALMYNPELEQFRHCRRLLERSMLEDPEFAMPVAWSAWWHGFNVGQGWSSSFEEDAARAAALAARAIELDRHNALALAISGHLKSYLGHDCRSALASFDLALAAGPSHPLAWFLSSMTLSYIGETSLAVQRVEHALRLSPFDPHRFYFYNALGLAHYADGKYREAVHWCRMSASENPSFTANFRYLAASLVGLGNLEEAHQAALQMLHLEPQFGVNEWARTRQPFIVPDVGKRFVEHLLCAGLPE